jgi:hypothetical protein
MACFTSQLSHSLLLKIREQFLDLVRSNEHLGESYIQEDFKIPTLNDIRNAQPVPRVLPKDVVGHATLIATTLASGGEQDVLLS